MKIAPREAYGRALVELGRENSEIVVLDADVAKASMTVLFKEAFPDRFFDLGIAESDIMATGAGFAVAGKIPFVNAYANFLLGNGWEQLRLSVCYSNQNVKVVGHNIGASSAKDGPTHLPLEDIALARVIPGLTVLEPADAAEMKKAVRALAAFAGPAYMRVGRMPVPVVTKESDPFVLGRANICRAGRDVTIVACGCMVAKALEAAELLSALGIEAEVINLHTIKPLDEDCLLASARKTGAVVTAEEHSVRAGMGSAVAELLAENCPVPMRLVGSRDVFGICASYEEIQEYFGMTSAKIVEEAQNARKMRFA
ncbi:MAG: transketolase family protein [Gracilibacteraceae bacterium]|jgi:transketolase|nr:transketolase family protein [Gracilibacteraceae bacterium]